jgi:hypothetical protein
MGFQRKRSIDRAQMLTGLTKTSMMIIIIIMECSLMYVVVVMLI